MISSSYFYITILIYLFMFFSLKLSQGLISISQCLFIYSCFFPQNYIKFLFLYPDSYLFMLFQNDLKVLFLYLNAYLFMFFFFQDEIHL